MPRKRKYESEPVEPITEIVVFSEAEVEEFLKGEGRPYAIRYAALRAYGVSREQAAKTAQLWLAGFRSEREQLDAAGKGE